jgi:hypothetical protein
VEAETKGQKLPVKYWRWTWAAETLRGVSILLIIPLLLVYLPAKGLVWALDWVSDYVWRLRQAMYCLDLYRSGWKPSLPPRERIELSPEWAARLADKDHTT